MSPEAIRIVSRLRQEFYARFTTAMTMPINVTSSSPGNFSIASWLDDRQRMNYMCVYAHAAPDELVPERPLILRITVNTGAGTVSAMRWGRGCQGLNQSWQFELTLLPEEILDFLPWIVGLIKSHDQRTDAVISAPPYPINFKTSDRLLFNAWTQRADRKFSEQLFLKLPNPLAEVHNRHS
jgi:hypothetical protein